MQDVPAVAAEEPVRKIYVNKTDANAEFEYIDNSIHTSKYTIFTFLPKNLYEQFRRVANFYFLVIVVLQMIPGLSPVNPWSSILPLLFVLSVNAIKEAYEDYQRHKSDANINSQVAHRLNSSGQFEDIEWTDVAVGDIIEVLENERIPADIVVLSSSEPQGTVYVETANLDGETNLKIRQALPETNVLHSGEVAAKADYYIECELPNNRLYKFEGKLIINEGGITKDYPLELTQSVFRGCTLRNTEFAMGVVVFTGHDTKLMQNSCDTPSKQSQLEKKMNKSILLIFGILFTCALICAIGASIWSDSNTATWYMEFEDSTEDNPLIIGAKSILTFIILFNVMVPISLYVSLELVKMCQALFMNQDREMYYELNDTPARARTSNLGEELGQIQYVFSDKTGTLTCNQMDFMKCCVAGESYGQGVTEIAIAAAKRKGVVMEGSRKAKNAEKGFNFEDDRLVERLRSGHAHAGQIHEFLTLLSVCHTVLPEESEEDPDQIIYQAASPDEGALVTAAKCLGYKFHTRNVDSVEVEIDGKNQIFQILNVLEFNSTRKRMSVVARTPEGRIILYCKGADSVIYARLQNNAAYKDQTLKNLEIYASEGLRTLCLSKKELSEEEYAEWNKIYHEASVALQDREQKVEAAAELVEKDLELLGCTAIEDKLQDGVPDAIATMAKAGIKIWVLTGDKQETAINIGFACQLLTQEQTLIVINSKTQEETTAHLRTNVQTYTALKKEKPHTKLSLVIDGATLAYALSEECKMDLLQLGTMCVAVVCCRVSPLQKAQVVQLVKDTLGEVTLAIGDGANDVSMIQAAHVGVGISGQEGLQAVLASDYSIAQFKYLVRLLLVHGRWSYYRVSTLMNYSFYKNMTFALLQFFFQWYCGFSGQTLVDSWYISVFNLFFTGLPIIVLAIFDQDVPPDWSIRFPKLYSAGHTDKYYKLPVLGEWLAEGVWSAIVMFFFAAAAFKSDTLWDNGETHDLSLVGASLGFYLIITVTIKLGLTIRSWNFYNLAGIILSLMGYLLITTFVAIVSTDNMYMVAFIMWSTLNFYWVGIAAVALSVIPGHAIKFYYRWFKPEPQDIVREAFVCGVDLDKETEMISPVVADETEVPPTEETGKKSLRGAAKFRAAVRTVLVARLLINGVNVTHTGYGFAQDPGWANIVSSQSTDARKESRRAYNVRRHQSILDGRIEVRDTMNVYGYTSNPDTVVRRSVDVRRSMEQPAHPSDYMSAPMPSTARPEEMAEIEQQK